MSSTIDVALDGGGFNSPLGGCSSVLDNYQYTYNDTLSTAQLAIDPLDVSQTGMLRTSIIVRGIPSWTQQYEDALLEEVMDYRTYCCAIAAVVQKPTAALVLITVT